LGVESPGVRIRTTRERLSLTIGTLVGVTVVTVILTAAFAAPVAPIVSAAVLGLAVFWLLSLRST
jgi:hypothetical protein